MDAQRHYPFALLAVFQLAAITAFTWEGPPVIDLSAQDWYAAWDCPWQCHGDADCQPEGNS